MKNIEPFRIHYKNSRIYKVILALFVAVLFNSCEKFLDLDPPRDKATLAQIFENDQIATSSITGVYSRMSASGSFSGANNSLSTLCGLSADEFKAYNLSLELFYKNDLTSNVSQIGEIWGGIYTYIYTANAVIEGLGLSNNVTESTRNQLKGEAKFIRAFCYFYLVNLFGNVPLNLDTDYRVNEVKSRTPVDEVYKQIIADLIDAEKLLPVTYVTTERVRPNKYAAKALLSRVYLYTKNWDLAAQKATEVIDQKTTYAIVDLDKVFLKNSLETIWQLMPGAGNNTNDGALFVLVATPTSVSLAPAFAVSFENGDNRRSKWIGEFTNNTGTYYYPFKYKVRITINGAINEYSMVLRLAELYLIRAEAYARLNKPNLSLEDLNLIRKRAGLNTPLVGFNDFQCITEVEKQRRLELFSEWGHRWFDLKRNGTANSVLSPIKGAILSDNDQLYPIPDTEILRNPASNQNPGY